jgi:Holliday junction resolvasome RuvABC endonuclease subunit
LTSTGVATAGRTKRIRPGAKLRAYERLRFIRSQILDVIVQEDPDLVIVEGPSFASVGKGQHERGGLWWMVTEAIDAGGIPLAVAPPNNIKKYATGVGGGPKSEKDFVMTAAVRRFPWFEGNNDEADALWACAMAFEWSGNPLVEMPSVNREAINGCSWPEPFTFSRTDDDASGGGEFSAPLSA